jgi:hypothetical protein
MEITWGFLLLFTIFIFPGLIIRRLYFFGEFSKQFGYNDPLLKTVAYALVPGLINAILAFLIYDTFIGDIDLGKVFDAYKDMSDGTFRHAATPGPTVDQHFKKEVLPFLGLLYLNAFLIGLLSGQLVRWTALDTRFKLFRFKNQWFYLFSGSHRRFKKYQQHFTEANRFLFAKVDVMVEAGGSNQLYSGTLVDYELDTDNCRELSKVVLKDAHRYSKDDNDKVQPKAIPGNLFVLDCSKLVNINVTHVYETEQERAGRTQAYMQSGINWIVVITILIFPLLFFRIDVIHGVWYDRLMAMTWLGKVFAWLFVAQLIQLPNPIVQDRTTKLFRYATLREWILKIVMTPVLYGVAVGMDNFSKWFLSLFA